MNKRAHQITGGMAGGVRALAAARDQRPVHALIETVGGIVTGVGGGMLPDLLEPAVTPNHRAFAHSWTTAVAVLPPVDRGLHQAALVCRRKADEFAARREPETDLLRAFLLWVGELLLRLAAGACHALAPGYGSHLLLDLTTPRRLPAF